MKMSSNVILITGATSGIGLGLAKRFLEQDNEVIICGRREGLLNEIKQQYPRIQTRLCDIAIEEERVALYDWATTTFPRLNVLINNAGIQRPMEALPPQEPWHETAAEIETNLNAPIHLTFKFAPHLEKQPNAALIMVTSGLAFAPSALTPVYSATKAALHSFTLSARYALGKKGIEVIEIIPPAVDTDLGGVGRHTGATPVSVFVDAVMSQLEEQKPEATYGFSTAASRASREELEAMFARMNR